MGDYSKLPTVDVVAARFIEGTSVFLDFSDGVSRLVDLAPLMNGPVWDDIRQRNMVASFAVDSELGTIVWPNGVDIAPEVLRYNKDLAV